MPWNFQIQYCYLHYNAILNINMYSCISMGLKITQIKIPKNVVDEISVYWLWECVVSKLNLRPSNFQTQYSHLLNQINLCQLAPDHFKWPQYHAPVNIDLNNKLCIIYSVILAIDLFVFYLHSNAILLSPL
jgi:hypothetical protein